MNDLKSNPNVAVVLEYVEAMNRGDFDRLATLFTPDALIHGAKGWGGVDIAMPVWRALHMALEMRLIVEDIVSDGDSVAVRFTERGRWIAPFLGQEGATGNSYEIIAIEWFDLMGRRIRRRWGVRDTAAQARQTGMA